MWISHITESFSANQEDINTPIYQAYMRKVGALGERPLQCFCYH